MRRPALAMLSVIGLLAAGPLMAGCADEAEPGPAPATSPTRAATTGPAGTGATATAITVTSPAFTDGAPIPARYSCRGQNAPPPLAWAGAPAGAATFALVIDDPDAVGGRYIHWVVTDIPASTTRSDDGATPAGGRVSANSGGNPVYLGPCPPAGSAVHHYRFTVYALSTRLNLARQTPAPQAVQAITRAAIGQGQLTGTYTG